MFEVATALAALCLLAGLCLLTYSMLTHPGIHG